MAAEALIGAVAAAPRHVRRVEVLYLDAPRLSFGVTARLVGAVATTRCPALVEVGLSGWGLSMAERGVVRVIGGRGLVVRFAVNRFQGWIEEQLARGARAGGG
jgi:hypothetical protein